VDDATTDTDADRKAASAAAFGAGAAAYRESAVHSEGADLATLASWCGDARVALDVATGAGHVAGALRGAGVERVVATDAAPAMAATCRASYPGVEAVVGDAERLPVATGAVDAVTCRIAAHHFPDPEAFVAEAARVLRPGGTFAFEDNVAPAADGVAAFVNRLERMRDPTHVRSHAAGTWRDWLREAGFSVETTEHVVKRIEVGPWIDRAPGSASEAAIRETLDGAPAPAAEALAFRRDETGRVTSFGSPKALFRAVRRDS